MEAPSILGHSIRFWRNSLIAFLVLGSCLASALYVRRSPLHLLWVVPLCYLGSMVLQTHRRVHPRLRMPRPPTERATPAAGYVAAEFTGEEGLRLAGWYKPGRNRAAVIVVHAFGLDGLRMARHSLALTEQGYGVLLLDLRAHGHSQGDTSTPGWQEAGDVLAAVGFLKAEAVDRPQRIGVIGISLGGQAALWAAAQSTELGAVIAEGPGPSGPQDRESDAAWPAGWLQNSLRQLRFSLLTFMSGERTEEGLLESIQKISPRPVLLISAGQGRERAWLRRLARAAREPKELWELPEAGHGAGLLAYPQLYNQKIVSFFAAALSRGPG